MATTSYKHRPKYLSLRAILFEIRLPLSALVSILHRVSGVFLFMTMAWFVYLFDLSLTSEPGYRDARALLSHPLSKAPLLMTLWALLHHLFAGLRFLLIDVGIGVDARVARRSSVAVLALSIAGTALLVWWIL